MKTYSAKPADVEKKWVLIDAEGPRRRPSRARSIAMRLRGKHKATFTPHVDCGDNVIVINAEKVVLTGNKREQTRSIYWHTGYPGGIKERSARARSSTAGSRSASSRRRSSACCRAARSAASSSATCASMPGADHPHEAQQPVSARRRRHEPKNTRSA